MRQLITVAFSCSILIGCKNLDIVNNSPEKQQEHSRIDDIFNRFMHNFPESAQDTNRAASEIRGLGVDAINFLLIKLGSQAKQESLAASILLRDLGTHTIGHLRDSIRNHSRESKLRALRVLFLIGPYSLPVFFDSLDDDDIRSNAVKYIVAFDSKAIPFFIDRLKSTDDNTGPVHIDLFGKVLSNQAIEVSSSILHSISILLDSEHPTVRKKALLSLSTFNKIDDYILKKVRSLSTSDDESDVNRVLAQLILRDKQQ